MIDLSPLLAAGDPMQHVNPHTIVQLGPFNFTNHMLMLLITAGLMLIVFPMVAKNYPMIPSGVRNFFESIMEFIRNEVAKPALHEHTDKFMPFLWTLFFFILFNNLLGLVPLDPLSLLLFRKSHLFGTATSGISVTAGLAACAFIMFNAAGVAEQYRTQRCAGKNPIVAAILGFILYIHSFAPHIPGVIGLALYLPLLVLEIILSFVKPFALTVRLYANMFAGHVVLASLLLLIPVLRNVSDFGIAVPTLLGCVALSCLELFVAFLQAYIFVFLTSMFIGAAVSPEH